MRNLFFVLLELCYCQEGVAVRVLLKDHFIEDLSKGKEVINLDCEELLSGYRLVDLKEFLAFDGLRNFVRVILLEGIQMFEEACFHVCQLCKLNRMVL